MNSFKVRITEVLSRTINVSAESEDVAIEIARKRYDTSKIILDYSNFEDCGPIIEIIS